MGLFGNNRKKSLWDTINGLQDDTYAPSNPTAEAMARPVSDYQSDPSIGDVSGAPKKGFNWGRAAAGFFGGQPVVDMFEKRDAEKQTQEQAQQLLGEARRVIKDPAEWAAFQVDPKKWAETRLSSQYGFHEMAPGHTGMFGNPNEGGSTYMAPETFNNGVDRVQYDGNSGQSNVVYQGKDDWTRYADSLGLQPGTPQYAAAQKDYALRAQGPTGFQQQQQLIQQRGAMQQTVKGMPSYAQAHPQAGGGGGGAAARPSATRVVGGRAYYKIHGQWYDNPEGR